MTFFGGFAGIYYWFPKMFGNMMNETLGKIHFFFTFRLFQLRLHPAVPGRPRRKSAANIRKSAYDYLKPVQPLHVIATIAAIGLLIGQLPFVINLVYSLAGGRKAGQSVACQHARMVHGFAAAAWQL